MSARPWTFQQGILWAMDFGSAQSAVVTAEGSLPAGSGRQTRIAEVLATESRVRVRVDEARPDALADLARAMYAPEPAARGSLPSAGFAQGTARGAVASAAETRAQSDVARRFETGRRCFVGRLGEEIVTYGWLTIGDESVGELERNYHMQPGEAYIWDCATLPAHRGSGLYGALLSHIVQTLRAEGIRRAWIGANLDNEPSLRAFARAGFQPVVQVAYARLLRLRCLMLLVQPAAPAALVDRARGMLTEPYERAWRALIVGVRPVESSPPVKARM